MAHACELETSIHLAIDPDAVDMDLAVDERGYPEGERGEGPGAAGGGGRVRRLRRRAAGQAAPAAPLTRGRGRRPACDRPSPATGSALTSARKRPLGHAKHLATLPLGVTATLDADARSLTVEEPALRQAAGG
jgi:hypothetical protein